MTHEELKKVEVGQKVRVRAGTSTFVGTVSHTDSCWATHEPIIFVRQIDLYPGELRLYAEYVLEVVK